MDPETANIIRNIIVFYAIAVSTIVLRSWGQAWLADKRGDPSPRADGRLSLNPQEHIDTYGTLIWPLISISIHMIMHGTPSPMIFGWGRRLELTYRSRTSIDKERAIAMLGGFGMNLIICTVAVLIGSTVGGVNPQIKELMVNVIFCNAAIMAFNVLPIPTLDGSWIMKYLLKMSDETYMRIASWSMFILIAIFIFKPLQLIIFIILQAIASPFLIALEIF